MELKQVEAWANDKQVIVGEDPPPVSMEGGQVAKGQGGENPMREESLVGLVNTNFSGDNNGSFPPIANQQVDGDSACSEPMRSEEIYDVCISYI